MYTDPLESTATPLHCADAAVCNDVSLGLAASTPILLGANPEMFGIVTVFFSPPKIVTQLPFISAFLMR
jgi:hypothetical protein